MKASSLLSAVEARPEKSRGCLQDLIGAPEFAVLALEFLDARPLLCRHPGAQSSICLCLAHPFAQRLGGHAQLRRHRADRRPLGVVLSFVFKDHPHGPLPDFTWIPLLCVHDSILSKVGVSGKPEAVHSPASGHPCLLYTSPSPRDGLLSRMPSSA